MVHLKQFRNLGLNLLDLEAAPAPTQASRVRGFRPQTCWPVGTLGFIAASSVHPSHLCPGILQNTSVLLNRGALMKPTQNTPEVEETRKETTGAAGGRGRRTTTFSFQPCNIMAWGPSPHYSGSIKHHFGHQLQQRESKTFFHAPPTHTHNPWAKRLTQDFIWPEADKVQGTHVTGRVTWEETMKFGSWDTRNTSIGAHP